MTSRGQQDRQAADPLHGRVEIEQRMAPVAAARDRPFFRRELARLESGAERLDPVFRNRAAQQETAVVVELSRGFCVERAQPHVKTSFIFGRSFLDDGYLF